VQHLAIKMYPAETNDKSGCHFEDEFGKNITERETMLFLDWELKKVSVTIFLSILMLFLGINIINTNWYNVDNINEYYAKIDNI
jgi:hypothetical protein